MKRRLANILFFIILFAALYGITVSNGVGFTLNAQEPASSSPLLSSSDTTARPRLDVPYVPTPQEVVDAMLSTAAVNKDDILYDLGCGDGRIVVTAAKRYGIKGLGVDIDPERIKESRENARKAQVTDRVQFVQKSLFDLDLKEASIVTLYLLPSINLKLRPKLFSELKPGTRIVSHDFDMGEWKPESQKSLDGHTVYFWVIPANASGTWKWKMQTAKGEKEFLMNLRQQFQNISGTLRVDDRQIPIAGAKLKGSVLQVSIGQGLSGLRAPMLLTGEVNGNTMQGTIRTGVTPAVNHAFSAARDQSTVTPIEGPGTQARR